MNQAAYAINLIDNTTSNDNDGALSTISFSELTEQAVWGAQLNIDKGVIATHQELAMLRQCAEHALHNSDRVVHVISAYTQQQTFYLVKTLMHLGISCGQIIVRRPLDNDNCPVGVWLFVEDLGDKTKQLNS
jgi:hypothetical protein